MAMAVTLATKGLLWRIPHHTEEARSRYQVHAQRTRALVVEAKVRAALPRIYLSVPGLAITAVTARRQVRGRTCRPVLLHALDDEDASTASAEQTGIVPVLNDDTSAADRAATEEFLTGELGLSNEQLAKVRNFWSYSGERTPPVPRCRMIAEYLGSADLGQSPEQVRRTISECPEVLEVYSAETLKEKVRFLRQEIGLEEHVLAEVVAADPKIFSRYIKTTLRPAAEFWMGTMGLTAEELVPLMKTRAREVWSRPEFLSPKWRFVNEVMGFSASQVLDCKVSVFSMPLDTCVAPRHFYVIKQGLSGLSLDDIISGGAAAFCDRHGFDQDAFKAYLQEWPYSEQARTLAWIKQKKLPRIRKGYTPPSRSGNRKNKKAGASGGNKRSRAQAGERYSQKNREFDKLLEDAPF
eukprot:TRINITY_DN32812_c0_g1_i1.p1 TRINITY_DN32812_c0_g1~~TRINITY_DN32812_c0_g1_i1.p1  ORF type:complete len:424 (-),score=57.56 TRINITY_DN32812_c0_g1_i1:140-1369(-)